MEALRAYLKNLSIVDQQSFAQRCGTTIGYLRNALSTEKKIGESIVIAMERESGGQIPCESIRPDVDWAYIRGTTSPEATASSVA